MSDPKIAVVLTWRTPSDSGVEVHAREFADPREAIRMAPYYAEVYGSCRVHHVEGSDLILHSRAVPHGSKARDPEVIR